MKILIKNGRVIDPSNKIDKIMDVCITDGKITETSPEIKGDFEKIIDASGKWVVPGLIDLHVHFREPGFEYKETLATGSRSAAIGGFTTVCCMPNTNPVVDNEIVVEYLKMKAAKEAVVNLLFYGAVTKGQKGEELSDIGKMAKSGICGLSEDGHTVSNPVLLKTAMKYAGMFNLAMFSHCEDLGLKGKGQINSGEVADLLGIPGISNDSEDVVISRDIILARGAKANLHICHVSTSGGIQLIREAKARGEKITAEVTPHHFTLTDKDIKEYDTNFKMSPPLRSKTDVEAILKGLTDGTLDAIATDHAPHHSDDKNCEFELAANGIIGLETSVGLSITELVGKGILTPSQFIEKMSLNPAKILGIEKGTLSVGADADVTIIDPEKEYTISVADFASMSRNSPFGGRKVKGAVMHTICGGKIIVEAGKLREEFK